MKRRFDVAPDRKNILLRSRINRELSSCLITFSMENKKIPTLPGQFM